MWVKVAPLPVPEPVGLDLLARSGVIIPTLVGAAAAVNEGDAREAEALVAANTSSAGIAADAVNANTDADGAAAATAVADPAAAPREPRLRLKWVRFGDAAASSPLSS